VVGGQRIAPAHLTAEVEDVDFVGVMGRPVSMTFAAFKSDAGWLLESQFSFSTFRAKK
jgi:hypothetical protein